MTAILCPQCGWSNSEFNLQCGGCGFRLPERSLDGDAATEGLAAEAQEPDARIGQVLGTYQIQALLGKGGMGVVYRALSLRLNRPVALKMLPQDLSNDLKARARLIREARAASTLEHPNIGRILTVEEHEGQIFIVMTLYEGQTLQERLKKGALPVEESIAILKQLASGLAAAHDENIIHRDLKPANIMLTRSNQVKILDFGLAKMLSDTEMTPTKLTHTGQILGTLFYMSPEQIRADALDFRTDLWSLGIAAYEMLAGHPPFHGANYPQVMDRILMREPRSLQELVPAVPTFLVKLISTLLAKDPADRPPSAYDVLRLLEG